jgi:hypothetical protein
MSQHRGPQAAEEEPNMKRLSAVLLAAALALTASLSCSRNTPEPAGKSAAESPQKAAPANRPAEQPAAEPATPEADEQARSATPQPSETSEGDLGADELPDPFDALPGKADSDGVKLIEPGTQIPPTTPQQEGEPQAEKATDPSKNVWLDNENKRVGMKAKVVLREGALEMLVCLKHTKEHESILAVDAPATLVHTQLVLAGAVPGKPVQFFPDYRPATGQEIEIELEWKDENGKTHHALAQEWVKNHATGKQLEYPWIFGGSQFAPDGYYLAESGDLICVANFPSATLDLPVQSTDSDAQLLFEAFTDRIPPLGTEVTVYLKPVKKEANPPDAEPKP